MFEKALLVTMQIIEIFEIKIFETEIITMLWFHDVIKA